MEKGRGAVEEGGVGRVGEVVRVGVELAAGVVCLPWRGGRDVVVVL